MGAFYAEAIVEQATLIPIVPPLILVGVALGLFGEILIKIILQFPELLKFIVKLADPELFLRDVVFGIFSGIQLVFMTIKDLIEGILKKIFGKMGIDDDFLGTGKNSKYYDPNTVKCVKTSYLKYVILIVCPPLFVFMHKGIGGWMYILLDIALTFMFYFPGLIYAILICKMC